MQDRDLLQAFESYLHAYFVKRDLTQTITMFHETIGGFGTGVDEHLSTKTRAQELYKRDMEQAPGSISYSASKTSADRLTSNTGVVSAILDIKGEVNGQPFIMNGLRITTVFVLSDTWRIAHKHISFPTGIHEEGEAYPLGEIEERNRLLEAMVEEKTVELQKKNEELQKALVEVKTLSGLLPICAHCKKVRDDKGYWKRVEEYFTEHAGISFSHGICPTCEQEFFAKYSADDTENE